MSARILIALIRGLSKVRAGAYAAGHKAQQAITKVDEVAFDAIEARRDHDLENAHNRLAYAEDFLRREREASIADTKSAHEKASKLQRALSTASR